MSEDGAERERLRPWALLVWIAVVLTFAFWISGCATPPACPDAEAMLLQTRDGTVYLAFTPESMSAWNDAVRKEARGECRWIKPGST